MSSTTQTPATIQKRSKIQLVFKSAARLPRFPAINLKAGLRNGIGIVRNINLSPGPGEAPVVVLRLQVLGCTNLLAKDREGTLNPLVVVSLLHKKSTTPVLKRTANPVYAAKDATFDFLIYLSLADRLGVVELVVWDKETLTKEYLGEAAIPLEDWFGDKTKNGQEKAYGFDEPGNEPISLNLVSTRANTQSTGSIQVKLGFVAPNPNPEPENAMKFEEIYGELLRRTRPSLISAPPTEGVGTIRSHPGVQTQIQPEDGGGLSSDSDDSDDETSSTLPQNGTDSSKPNPLLDIYTRPSSTSTSNAEISTKPVRKRRVALPNAPFRLPTPDNLPTSISTSVSESGNTQKVSPATPSSSSKVTRFIPKMILRQFSGLTGEGQAEVPALVVKDNLDSVPLPQPPGPANGNGSDIQTGPKAAVGAGISISGVGPGVNVAAAGGRIDTIGTRRKGDWEFERANDIIGIVVLEIEGADDLPKWPNATHTGWDMDPFVVVAFSKKVFRTRVIRHSLNPVFDEKLFFHVRRSETGFRVQLTVLDWDKLSANDLVGDATFEVNELIESAEKPDAETGLYSFEDEEGKGEHVGHEGMRVFRLELATVKDLPGNVKPVIRFRAQYQPYDALRQLFWRHYLAQYDTHNTGSFSRLELTAMLDSLGSTLSRSTVTGFFTQYGKDPKVDEISTDQAVMCLEKELWRPEGKKAVDAETTAEPVVMVVGERGEEVQVQVDLDLSLGPMHFAGPQHVVPKGGGVHKTEPMQMLLAHAAAGTDDPAGTAGASSADIDAEDHASKSSGPALQAIGVSTSNSNPSPVERVVNVKNCPFCHRPRLDSKATIDVVTHIALCASQDWNKVDRIMVGNFVTASEAERKWYVQVIMDITAGEYKLGANSANVIVQNRTTGQLEEEKMQVYVRLGIRLLYKGFLSEMESEGARRLLKSLSVRQGMKYDDPESAKEIPTFIEFHGLNVNELQEPIDSFKTFNQFFYRKLKPAARPVESPEDPHRIVSAADCRLLTFESVSHATRLWIKGREFSIARLLGNTYEDQVEKYTGGALAIFRLAPQDYHRFHSPVEGRIGRMTYISGEYYTVNPQAIRTSLDVYGENARKIVPIDSPQFGQVMAVCVGAMMVGSIQMTVEEGEYVQRGQEFGYFAFGGSTIVLLFEKGRVDWDKDLLINGRGCLETLVRVGMGIGRGHAVER